MSELKTILSGRISGYEAKMLGASGREEELFRLLFDADKRTSDNAAWALTHLPPIGGQLAGRTAGGFD